MITTCGIFVICNNKLLIGKPTGQDIWSILKGVIDDNETPLDAALREFKEETNIDVDKIKLLDIEPISTVYKHKKKKLISYFATSEKEYNAECFSMVESPNRLPFPEIEYFKWLDIEEALKLIHETQYTAFKIYESIQIN